jgi:hypothetical protein
MDKEAKYAYYQTQIKAIREDKIIRESYAKVGCKHCKGLGTINYITSLVLCNCVIKNLKKEIEKLG